MIEWWWTLAAIPPGMLVGWVSCDKLQKQMPPSDDQLRSYMNRIVNMEEVEEHQRLTKFRMARNGRKTVRYDGGPNATMLRLRVRPTSRRFRQK